MLLGVMYFADWIQQQFETLSRERATQNTEFLAGNLAPQFESQFDLENVSRDSEQWIQMEKRIAKWTTPSRTTFGILDLETGQLSIGPESRSSIGKNVLKTKNGDQIIGELVKQSPSNEVLSGLTTIDGQQVVMSLTRLTDSKHAFCVVQDDVHNSAALTNLMLLVRQLGFGITLLIGLVSTSLIVVVLQRYDSTNTEQKSQLKQIVDERSASLMKTKNAIIFGLAKLAESRDTDTGEHLERIRRYVTILTQHLKEFDSRIDDEYIANIGVAASLHDIGKVGIPDAILLKPGSLTQDERFVMEQHTVIGGECLDAIQAKLGEDTFLEMARKITYGHHERWDGTGYPYRLSGEDIPLEARIVSVADVYDALTTKRPYKKAMSHEESKAIIVAGTGTQFDPEIVEAFVAKEDEFRAISENQKGIEMPAIMALESSMTTLNAATTTANQ